jgi:transcriptional regulator with XRE-family HTH domain
MDATLAIKNIGEQIKILRIKAGYTSYETFAIENNMHRQTYYRAEKGKNITLITLIDILNAHNMSLAEFFKDMKE